MTYCFLSGGTGTPKLLIGFRELVDESKIRVICNTGDDIIWNGLHISPDLDTVLYLFANKLDLEKFWGVKGDTFNSLEMLKSLDIDDWFNVGDKDLGLHIFRTQLKNTYSLTEISRKICKLWDITAKIVPMADSMVQSKIETDEGILTFQEFFVKHRFSPTVKTVYFDKEREIVPVETLSLIHQSKNVIIGPSNPVTSIGPILELNAIKNTLQENQKKTIAISPIIGESAFSGPTIKLMNAIGIEPNPLGIASYYSGMISHLILDPSDRKYQNEIFDLGIEPVFRSIQLSTLEDKINLAEAIIELF